LTQQRIGNYAKFIVSEADAGDYMLNTTSGNHQPRQPIHGVNRMMPKYPAKLMRSASWT